MKLYTFWRSQAAFRVRIALNLKGLTRTSLSTSIAATSSSGSTKRRTRRAWCRPCIKTMGSARVMQPPCASS